MLIAVSVYLGLSYRHNRQLRAEIGRRKAHYLKASRTIRAMLARLNDRRLDSVPRLLDLCGGLLDDALSFYDRIRPQADANDVEVCADTARALSDASVVQSELGHPREAEELVRRSVALFQGLRAGAGDDRAYLEDQLIGLMRRGSYLVILKRPEEAAAAIRESVELAERLARGSPSDLYPQERLALCHHNHANALLALQKVREAREEYQKAIAIRERIDPQRLPGVTQRLAQSYYNLGVIHWKSGDQSLQAEKAFRRAEDLLLSQAPDIRLPVENIDMELARVYVNWSGMLLDSGRFEDSVRKAQAGVRRIEPYRRLEPNDVGARRTALGLHGNKALALSGLGNHAESAREWEEVIRLSDRSASLEHRVQFAIELAESGNLPAALAQIQNVKPADGVFPGDCYNIACLYARFASARRKDRNQPPRDRERLIEL